MFSVSTAYATWLAALWVAAPASIQESSSDAASTRAPNIVLILSDDQGWGDIGTQGARGFATPHLDRLAAEGVRLTDFYVAQSVCSASRAALLTGCYPNRIGLTGALGPTDSIGLHSDETTLAELLRERGYATALFGKWHLGHQPEFNPLRHGFDVFFGIPYSHDMWPHHPRSPKGMPDLPLLEGEEVLGLNPDAAHFTDDLTARAVAFIETCATAERPFFVFLSHPMPHVPLAASSEFVGRSQAGLYGDVIEELDDSVGRVLEALQRSGVDEHTLVLFCSDNGPWLTFGDHAGSGGGLREGKSTTFEGGVRVPFLARWPGHIPPGSVCGEPAMTIDLLPTLAGLVDAPANQPERPIDGRDIWPLLAGEAGARTPHAALYFYSGGNRLEALRSGRWKLHFPHTYRTSAGREAGRGGQPGGNAYEARIKLSLFDLAADPAEARDVAASHPEIVSQLVELAESMRADLGDDLLKRPGPGRRAPGRQAK